MNRDRPAVRPRVTLPSLAPPSPEEVERRRALAQEADRLRQEIGPIGILVADLIRADRGD